jgi:hypothetical protein
MDVSPYRTSRRKSFIVLVLACVCASVGVAPIASGAATQRSQGMASRTLRAAIASASREGSVRVTVHFFSGHTTGEVVQDSAQQSAEQSVAIGKERISILLVDGVAYISGNSEGLVSYFGIPKPTATTIASQWISIPPTDSSFKSVVSGLTLPAALDEVSPTGTLSEGQRSKVNGKMTASISGSGTAGENRATLFVATAGRKLPVEFVANGGTAKKETGEIVTFSRWGERVHIHAPADAIPISILSSGAPPTG